MEEVDVVKHFVAFGAGGIKPAVTRLGMLTVDSFHENEC